MEGLEEMLYKLGELAWRCLRKPVQQLLVPKVIMLYCYLFHYNPFCSSLRSGTKLFCGATDVLDLG